MTKSLALARLLWRPAALFSLPLLFWAAIWPGIIMVDRYDHGLQLGSHESIVSILWIEAIVLMSTVGGFLGAMAREVSQPLYAFVVPSLRSTLLRQKVVVGGALAVLLGGGLFLAGDRPGSVAVFGCALGFFSLGSFLSDPLTGGWWKAIAMGVMIVAWFEAERLIKIFQGAPALWAAGCFVVGATILYREQSIDAARRRALYVPVPRGLGLSSAFKNPYSAEKDSGFVTPTAAPVSGRVIEFFRAADYEVFGTRAYGWVKTLLTTTLLFCVVGYLSGNPSMVGLMGLMIVSVRPRRLMGRWPYPISRPNRANLAFLTSLADCLPYFALGMIITVLLARSGLPRLAHFELPSHTTSNARDLGLIPAGFIWSPIAMWTAVTGGPPTQKQLASRSWSFRRVIAFVASILLASFTFIGLRQLDIHLSLTLAVATGIALAIVVQGGYWLALRWSFAKSNLI